MKEDTVGDTLKENLNRIIIAELDQIVLKGMPYIGRLSEYDKDFIALKPHERVSILYPNKIREAAERLEKELKEEAGLEILLNRKYVSKIHKFEDKIKDLERKHYL